MDRNRPRKYIFYHIRGDVEFSDLISKLVSLVESRSHIRGARPSLRYSRFQPQLITRSLIVEIFEDEFLSLFE